MSTFERTLTMEVDPDHVFDFVSEPRNFPQFLPTVQSAEKLEGDRVRMKGVSHGHEYDSEGTLKLDRHRRRMEWSAEGDHGYEGWLEVKEGDATRLVSEIIMELKFAHMPDAPEAGERVLEEMEQSLENVRDYFLKPKR